jgi:hypothetical protein
MQYFQPKKGEPIGGSSLQNFLTDLMLRARAVLSSRLPGKPTSFRSFLKTLHRKEDEANILEFLLGTPGSP